MYLSVVYNFLIAFLFGLNNNLLHILYQQQKTEDGKNVNGVRNVYYQRRKTNLVDNKLLLIEYIKKQNCTNQLYVFRIRGFGVVSRAQMNNPYEI